ncbi:MAG: SUMF1/EgtB/PvdO family nonheme iron enzyme [Pseudomonadota bacterium]
MKNRYLPCLSILIILLSACQFVKDEPVMLNKAEPLEQDDNSFAMAEMERLKEEAEVERRRLAAERRAKENARQQAEIERLRKEVEAERRARLEAEKKAEIARQEADKKRQESLNTQRVESEKMFRDRLKDGGLGPEMVWIPAGRFKMGDNQGSDSEKPAHRVSVKRFAIGRYEVTFAEYDRFAKAMGRKKLKDWGWGRDNRPVINVSWDDAVAYTEWLSQQTGKLYRLASEAEWEYAARAGMKTKYWWGNDIGSKRANCQSSGSQWSGNKTAPVGSFAPNPFGLYDTAGNVWEWVADTWHNNYNGAPTDGSVWENGGGAYRLLRGGSWDSFPYLCRCANRDGKSTDSRIDDIGFRVALSDSVD